MPRPVPCSRSDDADLLGAWTFGALTEFEGYSGTFLQVFECDAFYVAHVEEHVSSGFRFDKSETTVC
jgi:hypothetical protein